MAYPPRERTLATPRITTATVSRCEACCRDWSRGWWSCSWWLRRRWWSCTHVVTARSLARGSRHCLRSHRYSSGLLPRAV